jgi:hypothetical protein
LSFENFYTENQKILMKNNYIKKYLSLILEKKTKKFSVILFVVFLSSSLFAQVNITKPNLSITVCSGYPSSYNALGNIVITESANGNFTPGTNITFILTAPANFEFQAGVGSVTYAASANITDASIAVTATQITVTYSCGAINKTDIMTISGLQVRAINNASTGNITRTGGTGLINGLTVIDATTVTNTLTSITGTPPTTANAGSNQTLAACITSTSLAGNVPTNGIGTWSLVSGTATITTPLSATSTVTGLALGSTATLRWTIANSPCASSTSDVTITTVLPNNPSNPTSNSPQCNPPGVTLTRVGTVPVNEIWYWQTVSLGTNMTNNSSTFTVTTSGTYYIRAYNTVSGCWSAGQGSLAVTISASINTLATMPSPATAATGICFAGSGAVNSISWTAAVGAVSYDVYFGAGSLPGTITANVAATSFTTGALTASTTYFWKIVPRSSGCPSTGTALTWTFTTAAAPCAFSYCAVGGSAPASSYISNVTLNTINQTNTAWGGYRDYYPSLSTNVLQSTTYTISVTIWNATTSQKNISAWIDWNLNGVFDVATETVLSTTSTVASAQSVTLTNTFAVPLTAVVNLTRLRVELAFNAEGAAAPCNINSLTDAQDYRINVQAIVACTTPTAQPNSLVLTPGGTAIAGVFTAALPAPNNYLVVINTTGVTPAPANGTTYTIGGYLALLIP